MRLLLAIEPRPVSTWGKTLASLLPKDVWDELRYQCYREANYQCEVCGTYDCTLNAHEVWMFNDKKLVMSLKKLECCCPLCHDVHHFGRSTQVYSKKYQKELIEHWCKVNKLTPEDFERHLEETRRISKRRANRYYVVKVGRYTLS